MAARESLRRSVDDQLWRHVDPLEPPRQHRRGWRAIPTILLSFVSPIGKHDDDDISHDLSFAARHHESTRAVRSEPLSRDGEGDKLNL